MPRSLGFKQGRGIVCSVCTLRVYTINLHSLDHELEDLRRSGAIFFLD